MELKKRTGNLLLTALIIPVISYPLIHHKMQWQGKIYEEDQVTVFKNPQEPLYGEISLELKEDLIIGDENEFPFYNRGIHADVDSNGNIYILDKEKYCVFSFRKDGKYMNSFESVARDLVSLSGLFSYIWIQKV